MARRRLYVLSCVDVFGRPFGGSLDIMERLKWAVSVFDTVIVFCPGQGSGICTKVVAGRKVIAVYNKKRLNVLLAVVVSAAVAWKPVFRLSTRRLQDDNSVLLFEGFLSICMLPQAFFGRARSMRRKIRVLGDEALFHLDRADTETSRILGWVLRLEAARLWILEKIFYAKADFDRCYISAAEARRFGMHDSDAVIPYLPDSVPLRRAGSQANEIVTVANFGLADNRRAIIAFLDAYLAPLSQRGFSVVIAGYGSDALREAYREQPNVRILGAISNEEERALYERALCYLVASNNRSGYKTRISTALAHGLIPVLHGRGAVANAEDALVYALASDLARIIDDGSLFQLHQSIADGQYETRMRAAVANYHSFLDGPVPSVSRA